MTEIPGLLSIFIFWTISVGTSFGKPTDVLLNPETLNPVQLATNESSTVDNNREERSPQFGLLNDYNDYSDYDDDARHFKLGHKFKPNKFHHRPHGCHGYGCGGGYPGHGGYYPHGGHGGYYPQGGQGGSFASASAGSSGVGGRPFGGSQANAQSASFSFGPYSATFSVAQASSGRQRI